MRSLKRLRRQSIPVIVISIAIVWLAGACNGGSSGGEATTLTGAAVKTETPAAVEPETSSSAQIVSQDCGSGRPHEPGSDDRTIVSGEVEREYKLHVPSSYTGEEAAPLVLNFHGLGSNAEQQATFSGVSEKAEEAGYIVVTPQGTGEAPFWNAFTANSPDVIFVGDMLDALEQELCIDADRVYSTGMSNGAMMSSRLACDLPSRIAAVAPVAGVSMPEDCPEGRAVAVMAFHGTDDRVLPFEGGAVGVVGIDSTVRPTEEMVADWAARNGCASEPQDERITEHVRLLRYDGCDDDATVELYVIEGGGHTWPDGALEAEFLGTTTREINATDLMWEFFEQHPMP